MYITILYINYKTVLILNSLLIHFKYSIVHVTVETIAWYITQIACNINLNTTFINH